MTTGKQRPEITKVQSGQAASPVATTTPEIQLELGKGLDIGTANLISAVQDVEGEAYKKSQRNAFIEIEQNDFTRPMLTQMGVQYVILEGRMVVVGDAAFALANILNQETRRPMSHGTISPKEKDARDIMRLLIEKLLGEPQAKGEVCYFSVPADPIDDPTLDITYHRELFSGLLTKLGYTAKPLIEGHAVVFSELAEDDFTGIGISCGGGMFNVCVAFRTIPALTFSTTRGGDWIDQKVAKVLGLNATKAAHIKEKGVDLRSPQGREQEAVEIYYRELIRYTLDNIKRRFQAGSDMPSFPDPVDMVFAGGTSMVEGFEDVVRDELEKIDFPIAIKNVRRADDPLHSVAKGCLVAAMSES